MTTLIFTFLGRLVFLHHGIALAENIMEISAGVCRTIKQAEASVKDTNVHCVAICQTRVTACPAKAFEFLFLKSTLGLTGCHFSWLWPAPVPVVGSARFMEMWKTYRQSAAVPD